MKMWHFLHYRMNQLFGTLKVLFTLKQKLNFNRVQSLPLPILASCKKALKLKKMTVWNWIGLHILTKHYWITMNCQIYPFLTSFGTF